MPRARGAPSPPRFAGVPTERLWLASTDADSEVPEQWREEQLHFAEAGADAVIGTVEPDRADAATGAIEAWAADYSAVEGHPHVHGAASDG